MFGLGFDLYIPQFSDTVVEKQRQFFKEENIVSLGRVAFRKDS